VMADYKSTSPYSQLMRTVLLCACDKAGVTVENVYRIKCGLMTALHNRVTHEAHVDQFTKHTTALMYLNDSDGDTLFYNKSFNLNDKNLSDKQISEKYICTEDDIVDRITPKANRFVVFNGLQYHSSQAPVNTKYRYVINFNFNVD